MQRLRSVFQKFRQQWLFKKHQKQIRRFYSHLIKPGDLVFDVGANIGSRSQIFLELGARVVAVEPQKECARTLFMRFGANPSFHLVNKALGATEGQAEMFISSSHEISSLSSTWVKKAQTENILLPNHKWEQTKLVQVTTLDKLIVEFGIPAYIKIDAEAYEFEIFRGLNQPIRLVSFEFHPVFLEPAVQSIENLERFGNLQMNYQIREDFSWALNKWVSAQEMIIELRRTRSIRQLYYGDIYVRIS